MLVALILFANDYFLCSIIRDCSFETHFEFHKDFALLVKARITVMVEVINFVVKGLVDTNSYGKD